MTPESIILDNVRGLFEAFSTYEVENVSECTNKHAVMGFSKDSSRVLQCSIFALNSLRLEAFSSTC